MAERISHPFGPVYDENSRVLILGSFPSVKSREEGFYYGHPRNRFWRVLAALYGEALPVNAEEKKRLILSHGLALWDSVARCDIKGSSDGSIRNAAPNDIGMILDRCPICLVCCNGQTAFRVYEKFILPVTGREALCLPSTSPANARWTQDMLTDAWRVILRPERAHA